MECDDPAEREGSRRPPPRSPIGGVQPRPDHRLCDRPRVRAAAAGKGLGVEGRPPAGGAGGGDGRPRDRGVGPDDGPVLVLARADPRDAVRRAEHNAPRPPPPPDRRGAGGDGRRGQPAPQLAYHFCEAAPAGDVDKAVGYAKWAGAKAMSMIAYEDAAAHYGRGLQALEVKETADDAARYD